MELIIYQIDAFAEEVFQGNPAAICPLKSWLPDNTLQAIATENNLSETAFFVENENGFHIRWFTPAAEVKLCGHATLASAHVIFNELKYSIDTVRFESLSGPLYVKKFDDALEMDLPKQVPQVCTPPAALNSAFESKPVATLKAEDYIVVFADEAAVKQAKPNLEQLKTLDLRAVCITAQSQHYDFVTRLFAPKHNINEDPVTGSAFTQLAPYWSDVLGKSTFVAKQVSKRGGLVECRIVDDRVLIKGKAIKYLQGNIFI